jgi:hypothetical protein
MIDVTEPQVGQAAQQRPNRNLAFDAGQLGADAVMNSPAERQRPHVASGGVETIGVRVDCRVTIGPAEQTHDSLPLFRQSAFSSGIESYLSFESAFSRCKRTINYD